jgi:hypothetical protein
MHDGMYPYPGPEEYLGRAAGILPSLKDNGELDGTNPRGLVVRREEGTMDRDSIGRLGPDPPWLRPHQGDVAEGRSASAYASARCQRASKESASRSGSRR